ncbi:MAG: outer membrane beta-barrel protein [Pseudolabrys sp.]|jgi:opacity protein-like surface antigen
MTGMRLKISMLAAATLLAVNAAHAADLVPLPPPPQPCCDNWYLRGYAGVGLNGNYTLDYLQNPANSSDFAFDYQSIADTPFVGGAVGYNWNNWLRFDVSAEYRAKTRVYAFGHYTTGGWALDTYEGNLDSWVFLANAFVDLGTWNCFTPFIGAGVGGAYVTLADFSDINPSLAGFGVGRNPSEWNLAYAFYAGVSYEVTKSLQVDLTYRYLNYGSITDTVDCFGGCNPDSFKFDNLYSNDIMLGLRWTCCDVAPPPPLETRG